MLYLSYTIGAHWDGMQDFRSELSKGRRMAASLMADPNGTEGQAYWYTSPEFREKLRVEAEEVEDGWVVV